MQATVSSSADPPQSSFERRGCRGKNPRFILDRSSKQLSSWPYLSFQEKRIGDELENVAAEHDARMEAFVERVREKVQAEARWQQLQKDQTKGVSDLGSFQVASAMQNDQAVPFWHREDLCSHSSEGARSPNRWLPNRRRSCVQSESARSLREAGTSDSFFNSLLAGSFVLKWLPRKPLRDRGQKGGTELIRI